MRRNPLFNCFPRFVFRPLTLTLLTPKQVAGLARRVHDASNLQEKFEKLVELSQSQQENKENGSQKRALDRRVPTRWNSDFKCLEAHVQFEGPVQQLTSDPSNKLKLYALTDDQWKLAKDLQDVLEVSRVSMSGIFSLQASHKLDRSLKRLQSYSLKPKSRLCMLSFRFSKCSKVIS